VRTGISRLLFVTAVCCLLAPFGHATTVRAMSLEELATQATHVIQGKAVESWTEWTPDRTMLYTYTRFDVSKSLKGTPGRQVVVRQMGGTDGRITQKVFGVRHFITGEQALLFLRPSSNRKGMVVVGLMQGNFRVAKSRSGEWIATNGVPGVTLFRNGSTNEFNGTVIKLAALEARVKQAVTK